MLLKHRRPLKFTSDASMGDLNLIHFGQIHRLTKECSPRGWSSLTSDDVHHRCLPAPLGPIMQRNSPTEISRFKWLIALKPSNETTMSSRYKIAPWVVSTPSGFNRW